MQTANSISLEPSLDSTSHVPLYVQLRDRLRGMIEDGRLRSGDRLSPTRNLAVELGVHRATVEAAYAELESEGLLVGHVGRGTFVAGRPAPKRSLPRAEEGPTFFWSGYFSDAADAAGNDSLDAIMRAASEPETISFAAAHPPAGLVPMREFRAACDRVLRRHAQEILRPSPAGGYPPLQRMLAARLQTSEEQVTVTNGCQQGLDLLAKAFLAPGQTVILENPVYFGALAPFRQAGARILGLPMTPQGPDLAALENMLESHRVRLIVVTPNYQNPTGATMPLEARRRLLELSRRYQVPVAENDSYGPLAFTRTLPTLKSMDRAGAVIHLGSFSKAGFPGLRLGWCVASPAATARIRRAKQSADLHTDSFVQAVIVEFAGSGKRPGALDRTLTAVAKTCQANAQTLAREVALHFPKDVAWTQPEGGMSAWFRLPAGVSADSVLARTREQGVLFTPGRYFFFHDAQPGTFRLCFGNSTRTEIARGVKIAGEAIRAEIRAAAKRPATRTSGLTLV